MKLYQNMKFAAAMAAAFVSSGSWAQLAGQTFPKEAIHVVVPYPPGGGADSTVRRVADLVSKKLGTPVIVDNKPGANTILAGEFVARQPPTGYSLLYVDSAFTINPALYKLRFSPIDDFAPVAMLAEIPLVLLANTDLPQKTLKSVIDFARANPEKISFASYGQGSRGHLVGELLGIKIEAKLLHVPFKGTAEAINSILGKQVDLAIVPVESALPMIRSGKVKILAVTTNQRAAVLPDVPTIAETVPGLHTMGWGGIAAPKGIDQRTLKILADAINEVTQLPEMQERFTKQGVESVVRSPDYMNKMFRTEIDSWASVVKAVSIKVD